MDNLRGDISQTFIKTNTKGNFCTIFCPKKVADLGGTGRIRQTVFEGILKIFRDLKFFFLNKTYLARWRKNGCQREYRRGRRRRGQARDLFIMIIMMMIMIVMIIIMIIITILIIMIK